MRDRSAVVLIAGRELRTRWQQRGYRIGLGVTLLIAVIAVVLPSLFSDGSDSRSYDLAVTSSTAQLGREVAATARTQGVRLTLHTVADTSTARTRVDDSTWDAALVAGPSLIARSSGDSHTTR